MKLIFEMKSFDGKNRMMIFGQFENSVYTKNFDHKFFEGRSLEDKAEHIPIQ